MMTRYAPALYDALAGVFCIYKPGDYGMKKVVHSLKTKLSQEMNKMECRPMRELVKFNDTSEDTSLPVVTTVPDLADHPLVVGERYQPEDFTFSFIDALSSQSSGVQLLCVGHGGYGRLKSLRESRPVRVYHVSGQLGYSTDDFSSTGRLIEKTTYHHVTQARIDKTVAAIQAGNQRTMYIASGVDLQTEEAYELAAKGLIRPKPVGKEAGIIIYNLKCIDYKPPHFTLEVHCINESNTFLMRCVHEIGLMMKSSAVCTRVRRIRYGNFLLQHALVRQDWDTASIIENIRTCREILTPHSVKHESEIRYLSESPDQYLLEKGYVESKPT